MKRLALMIAGCGLWLASCAPVHERTAGGAAFDESETARALDAGAQLPEESLDGARSFEEWRERE